MDKALFFISCTTCQARLAVRSQEAIGAILECPKCGSFVEIAPPEGWEPEPQPPAESAQLEPADAESAQPESPAAEATEEATADGHVPAAAAVAAAAIPGPAAMGVSSAELAWRKWLLMGALPVAGVVVLVGLLAIFVWPDRPEQVVEPAIEQPAEPDSLGQSPSPRPAPAVSAPEFDRRWLPEHTALLLRLRPSTLAEEPSFGLAIGRLDGLWQQGVGAVLQGLDLKPGATRRVTWAAADLTAWPDGSVVLVELEPEYSTASLATIGEPVDLQIAGVACRRLPDGPWSHPFAVIDDQTIVTGQTELLRQLAAQTEPRPQTATIERLLPLADADAELAVLIDLAAARRAGWELPTRAMDVWPPGSRPWRVAWEMAVGLGCRVDRSEGSSGEVVLVCDAATAAERAHAAIDELIPAARTWLAGQIETLSASPHAEQVDAAADYELLLKQGLAAADAAQWRIVDDTVWLGVDCPRGPSTLAVAVIGSRSTIRAAWLAAARQSDTANHQRLLTGLEAYRQAEGEFPAATVGGAQLSAQQQLSWIAAMLPFYGYDEWHGQLDAAQAWNSPQNRSIAERPLPEVVNPALGPGRTGAGFPVSHYVGVAGVGSDAAGLDAGDPRAGVFGHGRRTRSEDIVDGAANTIALLGASDNLGPWAAGGGPTVRPLTTPPYVDGPDGFGSGQPDGMLAGMADGSVRFLSNDIDPTVLEQMATINSGGRERDTIAAAGPSPVPLGLPDGPPPDPTPIETPGDSLPEETPPDEVPPDEPAEPAAPIRVDVEARRADAIGQIEFHDVPFGQAVGVLAALSTIPMTFDPEAMQQLGVTLRDPVSVELSETTVGEALDQLVAGRGMAAVAEDGQILLTTPADRRERLWARRYTVSDLTGDDPAAVAELASLVRRVVAPDSWRPTGGQGQIKVDDSALAVMQTGMVHDEVLVFCERLRNARRLPLRSRYSPARFTLQPRLDQAKAVLGRPVVGNFHEPVPLVEVLSYLAQLAEADILVDRLALSAAGLSDHSSVSATFAEQPLANALDQLLVPMDLAYRAIDAQTLQVTTQKALAAHRELEFYPVANLLSAQRTSQALIAHLKAQLPGTTWADTGGPGVLHFDQPSGHLLVLQSQPVQAELARLLAGLRNGRR